jgi:hypothetical protein
LLNAFAIIFSFGSKGNDLTATIVRERQQDPGKGKLTIEVTIAKNKGIGDADNYLATKLCLYLSNKDNASSVFDFPKFLVLYFCSEVTEKDIKRCNDKLFKQDLKGFHKLAKGIEIAGKIATLIERIKERFFKLELQ